MWDVLDLRFASSSPEETLGVARALGVLLRPGDVVALFGELGAGKTLFCKGIGDALGVPPNRVVSPTFTIATEYDGTIPLRHIDAYRLTGAADAEGVGIGELLAGEGICLVEWAERIEELLPSDCIRVKLTILEENRREIAVAAPDLPRFRGLRARSTRFQTGG